MLNFKTLSSFFLSSAFVFSHILFILLVGCNPSKSHKAGEGFVDVTDLFLQKYQGEYFQESLGNLSLQKEMRLTEQNPEERSSSMRDSYLIQVKNIQESKKLEWKQLMTEYPYMNTLFNLLTFEEKKIIQSQSAYVCVHTTTGRIYSILENFQKDFSSNKFPYLPTPELKDKVLALHQQKPDRRYYIILSSGIYPKTEFYLSPSATVSNTEIPELKLKAAENSKSTTDFLAMLKIIYCRQPVINPTQVLSWEVIPTQTATDTDGKHILLLEISPIDSQILFQKRPSENAIEDKEKSSQGNSSKLQFYQIKI